MNRPVRSLYSFPHAVGAAGIGTTALHQIRGLAASGVEVTLVCTSLEAQLPDSVRVVQTLRVLGKRLPHRVFGTAQRAYDYHDRRVARLLGGPLRPDVVHVWPRGCLRTLAAAERHGVVSVRELPNAHTASVFEESARAARESGVELPSRHSHRDDAQVLAREQAEFEAADFLLSPSGYVRSSFEARGFARDRLLDTRYGFDPDRFFPPPPGEAERPFTAVFLGRADPTKGLHLALRAWARSGIGDRGRFLIFGRLSDSFARVLASQLTMPGVEFRGFVRAPEAELRTADVLVLPSYTEGSALVTYEAIGSGCVPLVSTACGAPVQDGINGLTHEVGDVETLASQLAALSSSTGRLAELREGCLAVADDLTWAAAGRELAAAYQAAVTAADVPR